MKQKALDQCMVEHLDLLTCYRSTKWGMPSCGKEEKAFWACYKAARVWHPHLVCIISHFFAHAILPQGIKQQGTGWGLFRPRLEREPEHESNEDDS
jgi:hypothetical protein